ncbi:hypothetical protein Indivirus_3_30 [Indivirus ILV1]|uniref:Uncharacterized protein n=1 Tax=Indivirus ILV1 TaxID=1977633 RepID=A0A1V0SDL9_9VIRU|nr:hypothetical protein Indivirus_3_30 [Indivirus ILV1]
MERSNTIGTTIDNLRNMQQKEHVEIQKLKDDFDIEELTKDINDNIPDETFTSVSETKDDKSTYIPIGWKDPFLLLFIYLILSQALVRQFIGKYIPQLNPCADGTIGFMGVLIYGILLVTIYFISKSILL